MAAAAGMGDGSCGTGTSWMCIGGICWNPAVTFCCRKIIKKLYSLNIPIEKISEITEMCIEDVQKIVKEKTGYFLETEVIRL